MSRVSLGVTSSGITEQLDGVSVGRSREEHVLNPPSLLLDLQQRSGGGWTAWRFPRCCRVAVVAGMGIGMTWPVTASDDRHFEDAGRSRELLTDVTSDIDRVTGRDLRERLRHRQKWRQVRAAVVRVNAAIAVHPPCITPGRTTRREVAEFEHCSKLGGAHGRLWSPCLLRGYAYCKSHRLCPPSVEIDVPPLVGRREVRVVGEVQVFDDAAAVELHGSILTLIQPPASPLIERSVVRINEAPVESVVVDRAELLHPPLSQHAESEHIPAVFVDVVRLHRLFVVES